MKQVFLREGQAVVEEIPAPTTGEDEVLVKVMRSCISTGTELSGITVTTIPIAPVVPEVYVAEKPVPQTSLWKQILTDKGMWIRAFKDPRKIVRFLVMLMGLVLKKMMALIVSLKPSMEAPLWKRILFDPGMWVRAVKDPRKIIRFAGMLKSRGLKDTTSFIEAHLSVAYPLGYSAAGVVLEISPTIQDIFPGDRVACAGAQCAHHAEYISVPRNLLVPLPEELSFDEAAPVALGAIAMQGIRRAQPALGEYFAVIGLGLLGQITAQLLKANGCRVIGVDLDSKRIRLAEDMGMDYGLYSENGDYLENVNRLTSGTGVDCVIITAGGSEEILSTAFQMCRRKGRVILVGDVKININRSDIYRKELDFFISTSYGPGRYDREYEEKGVDYPLGYVRWTENRNMSEYLRLVAENKLKIKPLVGEIYPVERATEAYYTLKNSPEKPLIALLSYPDSQEGKQPVRKLTNFAVTPEDDNKVHVAIVGAGGFAKGVHLPNLKQLSDIYSIKAVLNRKGHNAVAVAKQFGASYSTTDFKQIIEDPDIDAVFITTRHHLHARLTEEALIAGKHVFVEKPLCLNTDELEEIKKVYTSFGENDVPILLTGFNRRFSPFARQINEITKERKNPMILYYTMNAGYIPLDHWVHGEEGGGRNIGEACHIYDLFTYLTGSKVLSVEAISIHPATKLFSYRDNFAATITFEDGSGATLTYTALGASEYPKEKLEVYCDNMVIILDNYTTLRGYGTKEAEMKSAVDKGHRQEILDFGKAILEKGSQPIPLWQQFQAMEIAFEVERLLIDKNN